MITSTAMLRIPSFVWGLSVFRWVIHILPSSFNASLMSLMRILEEASLWLQHTTNTQQTCDTQQRTTFASELCCFPFLLVSTLSRICWSAFKSFNMYTTVKTIFFVTRSIIISKIKVSPLQWFLKTSCTISSSPLFSPFYWTLNVETKR